MKLSFFLVLILSFNFLIAQDNQEFKLKDGTIINGIPVNEDEEQITVATKYGSVIIKKSELFKSTYEITLKDGDILTGVKLSETNLEIIIQSKLGKLKILKSDIVDMKETIDANQVKAPKATNRRPYSLADVLFGSNTSTTNYNTKNMEFALGEERLIDTFFDPTGYVLEEGTLYLSGFSYAFGVTEKLQISSRWIDYFWGNFNIRPKYRLFHKGNWEQESALSIGGHLHTYWQPNKVTFQSGELVYRRESYDFDLDSNIVTQEPKYFGGYFPIGSTIDKSNNNTIWGDDNDYELNIESTDDLKYMMEFFTAYTFSKARKGMKGRISTTIGALIQIPDGDDMPYRLFGSLDVDITSKLKMVGEVFYDPFFIDLVQRTNFDIDGPFAQQAMYKISDTEVTKDSLIKNRPVHFDFGLMYAVNENFRFGIHTQAPIIAFYWKL
tara:strand:+ start:376 stop:1695 length:1320 start_codon:yes stop_codon:yes gene_type:complete